MCRGRERWGASAFVIALFMGGCVTFGGLVGGEEDGGAKTALDGALVTSDPDAMTAIDAAVIDGALTLVDGADATVDTDAPVPPPDVKDGGPAPDASDANCAIVIPVSVSGTVNDLDLFIAAGSPSCAADVTLTIAADAVVGATATSNAALTIAGFAAGSAVTVVNGGTILGAGGAGGSGGNGGTGSPYCGRPGRPGGPAVRIETPTTFATVGNIFGGGGGGAGASGGNQAAGGGGGMGLTVGLGGAPATTLPTQAELAYCQQDNGVRTGTAGAAATALAPGPAVVLSASCRSGAGGVNGVAGQASNCYGSSAGGPAGPSISRSAAGTVNITSGTTNGTGPVRGLVVVN